MKMVAEATQPRNKHAIAPNFFLTKEQHYTTPGFISGICQSKQNESTSKSQKHNVNMK